MPDGKTKYKWWQGMFPWQAGWRPPYITPYEPFWQQWREPPLSPPPQQRIPVGFWRWNIPSVSDYATMPAPGWEIPPQPTIGVSPELSEYDRMVEAWGAAPINPEALSHYGYPRMSKEDYLASLQLLHDYWYGAGIISKKQAAEGVAEATEQVEESWAARGYNPDLPLFGWIIAPRYNEYVEPLLQEEKFQGKKYETEQRLGGYDVTSEVANLLKQGRWDEAVKMAEQLRAAELFTRQQMGAGRPTPWAGTAGTQPRTEYPNWGYTIEGEDGAKIITEPTTSARGYNLTREEGLGPRPVTAPTPFWLRGTWIGDWFKRQHTMELADIEAGEKYWEPTRGPGGEYTGEGKMVDTPPELRSGTIWRLPPYEPIRSPKWLPQYVPGQVAGKPTKRLPIGWAAFSATPEKQRELQAYARWFKQPNLYELQKMIPTRTPVGARWA